MADIPKVLLERLKVPDGLSLRGFGKVRDSFNLPAHPTKMLVRASKRVSAFDFVFNTEIEYKGEVLTALRKFWLDEVIRDFCETDHVACGAGIDQFVPEPLRGDTELQKTGVIVNILDTPEDEDIARFHLTGSGWESYQKNRTVCGHRLPAGLQDGSRLPFAIYTPTTKAKKGHDVHIPVDEVVKRRGHLCERLTLQLAGLFASYADQRGLIFADTKFEFFKQTLIDEFGTPDSSRFWDEAAWRMAQKNGKLPPSLDKQFLREWAKTLGIHKRKPEVAEDVAFVHEQVVPGDVRKTTSLLYRYIFWRLTGMKLERFQSVRMAIGVDEQKPRVEILIGSESDRSQVENVANEVLRGNANYRISVMSCHRNPDTLRTFAENELVKADRVISCAGKAAAKPGVIKAWLCHFGRSDIPVIGVALKGQTPEDDRDAVGSVTGLPGKPVELDENGDAYFGDEGVRNACVAAIKHEFLPKTIAAKPVVVGDWKD